MTNKEAIELLENDKQYTVLNSPRFIQALAVAIKALTDVPTCGENKPLTIPQLEQMDGLPVYVIAEISRACNGWYLIDKIGERLVNNKGLWIGYKWAKAYKEKPTPRMVTINQAVDDKLIVKYGDSPFMAAMESLKYTIERGLISGTYNLYDLFNEPCWEVDN